MSESSDVSLWSGNLDDADPIRRVLVLPGGGYPVQLPGLFLPMRALALAGWQVWAASWHVTGFKERSAAEEVVTHAADQFVTEVGAQPQLVLAKSLGTMAAGWVADRSIPAIWTTPLLTDDQCVDDISRASAPALLLAGSNDPAWDDTAASRTGKALTVISGADHGWQTGSWREELEILERLTAEVEQFAARLP